MNWVLTDSQVPDPASIDRNGNRFLSGNGHLGLRGTLDEHRKEARTALIVNGLYDRAGSAWREPVNAPNGCLWSISCNGAALSVTADTTESHRHELDFRHGIQTRHTVFRVPGGARLTLSSRRFVSLTSERLVCMELELTVDRDADLIVTTETDGDVWDLNGPHLLDFSSALDGPVLTLSARTSELSVPVHMAEVTSGPEDAAMKLVNGKNSVGREFRLRAAGGKTCTFHKYLVVQDGLRGSREEGLSECLRAAGTGFGEILSLHRKKWESRWQSCDIAIEGDDEAQTALRFSMYHLLAIAPGFGSALSIPARGLSGQVYKGGIFWDTEMFMLPFFLSSFPGIARSLLRYRIKTLDGARRKAREYGYTGAFYAWESQETGDDACTLFNVTDVFTGRPMRTFFRDRQIHISADIVKAFRDYHEATGDLSLFLEGGAEVVYESVRFLLSWLYYKPGKDRYELLDVTGPDEYHERVHNDYFTSLIASHALRSCLEMDALLAEHYPRQHGELTGRLNLGGELPGWASILERLYVPAPDPLTGIIEQFDGYLDLEELSLEDLLSRKLHEHEYLGGGNGLARWTRIIKQADVVLGLALFPSEYPEAVHRANFEFYEPRTEHGSSLSASAYSLEASRLGRTEAAYSYFMKTATIDITGNSKQFVGDLYIGGTHPAANGGAWLAAVRGFCGVTMTHDRLAVNPSLPARWNRVSLTLVRGEAHIRLSISRNTVEIDSDRKLHGSFSVEYNGTVCPWNGNEKLTLTCTTEDPACSRP